MKMHTDGVNTSCNKPPPRTIIKLRFYHMEREIFAHVNETFKSCHFCLKKRHNGTFTMLR